MYIQAFKKKKKKFDCNLYFIFGSQNVGNYLTFQEFSTENILMYKQMCICTFRG